MITRKVDYTRRLVKVYNAETDGVETIEVMSKTSDKKWERQIKHPYKYLTVVEKSSVKYLLKMDDNTFFAMAEAKIIEE